MSSTNSERTKRIEVMPSSSEEVKEAVEKLKNDIIERGLKACEEELKKAEGNMKHFYRGSIEGFKEAEEIYDLKTFEKRIKKLMEKELEMVNDYLKSREEPKEGDRFLKEYWELKGRKTQLQFVYNRLRVFEIPKNF